MTVIAYLPTPFSPLLLSDMLLSRDRSNAELADVYMPTVGYLKAAEDYLGSRLPFDASRLVRKQFIVNELLHVAWGGDVAAGEALRLHLKVLTAQRCDARNAFYEAIARLDISQQKSLSVIAVSLPDSNDQNHSSPDDIKVFTHGCIELDSPLWGKCYFGGSGAQSLRDWVALRDQLWSRDLLNDPEQLVAELLCARLIFAETLVTRDASHQAYSALLTEGCGGFYETNRFGVGGVLVPRDAIHLQFQYVDDTLRLTRLLTYSTGVPNAEAGRRAVIWSLLPAPLNLEWAHADVTFDCKTADAVLCPAFWDVDSRNGKSPIQCTEVDPANEWTGRTAKFKVMTSVVFENNDLTLEQIERHPPDVQMRLMENSGGSRSQLYVRPLNEDDPLVDLQVFAGVLRARIKKAWLDEMLTRFKESRQQEHVIIDR